MKTISKAGVIPFNIGGILANAVNLNGIIQTNINIYKQRSFDLYDIIDNNGDIHQIIRLTTVDANNRNIDPTLSDTEISAILPVNSFFIKGNDENGVPGLVSVIQLNKAKLNTGSNIFHPMLNLNFGSTLGNNLFGSMLTITSSPTNVGSTMNVYARLYNQNGGILKETQTVTFETSNENLTVTKGANNIRNTGLYSVRVTSTVATTAEFKIFVNSVDTGYVINVEFKENVSTTELTEEEAIEQLGGE